MMMKIGSTGFLFVSLSLLAACGGSKAKPAQPAPPVAEEEMTPAEERPSMVVAPSGGEETPPVVEPTPAPPPPPVAIAALVSVKDGATMGTVMFEQAGGDAAQIVISGQFNGFTPGKHAFYIHEHGDCTHGAKAIGGHLDPTKAKHGPPASSTRHAGDLGNLAVDADGNAVFNMTTDSLTMTSDGRPDSVIGRAVVVHAKPDDKKGSGGAVVACGIVAMRE